MFPVPPPTKTHWIYDDPSGVTDRPQQPWQTKQPKRPIRRPIRFIHWEA